MQWHSPMQTVAVKIRFPFRFSTTIVLHWI